MAIPVKRRIRARGKVRQSTRENASRISSGCCPRTARKRKKRLTGMPIQTRGDRNGDSRAADRELLVLESNCTRELGSGSRAYRAGGCPARRSRSIRRGWWGVWVMGNGCRGPRVSGCQGVRTNNTDTLTPRAQRVLTYHPSLGCRVSVPMLSFLVEPSLSRNVGPQPAFFCVQEPLQACGRGDDRSSALGQGPDHVSHCPCQLRP